MISYSVYKVIHLTGVLMVFLSLGGVAMHAINAGDKNHKWRKPAAITHGLGLLISLVGGFGLLARLGIVHGSFPLWVILKLAIWLVFGALLGVLIRKPQFASKLWIVVIILGACAAYIAGDKPL